MRPALHIQGRHCFSIAIALGIVSGFIRPVMAIDCSKPYEYVRLEEDVDRRPVGDRVPLILIHGIHGNRGESGDVIGNPPKSGNGYFGYFDALMPYLNANLKDEYKLYQFRYVSDVCSVSDIGKSLSVVLFDQIQAGTFPRRPFIIVAHSMGGLVARAFMQRVRNVFTNSKWGDEVFRLITLATPHHGSHSADGEVRFPLKLFNPGWDLWAGYSALADQFVWGKKFGCKRCGLDSKVPNRSDLRWDNYDHFWDSVPLAFKNNAGNQWLSSLNGSESFHGKTVAFWGFLGDRPEVSLVGSDSAHAWFVRTSLYVGVDAKKYLSDPNVMGIAGVQLQRIVSRTNSDVTFADNDGAVPSSSARYDGAGLAARVECPGYNHSEMANGRQGGFPCYRNSTGSGRPLFAAIIAEIPLVEMVSPPPTELVSGGAITASWKIMGPPADSGGAYRTRIEWVMDGTSCSEASPCKSVDQMGLPGTYSATINIPQVASGRDFQSIRYRAVAELGDFRVTTPETGGSARLVRKVAGPKLTLSASSLAFGGIAIGAKKIVGISLKNVGTSNLSGNVTVTGSFSISPSGGFSLGPLAERRFEVQFAPVATGSFAGTLAFATDGGNANVALSGNGISGATANLPGVTTDVAASVSRTNATLQGTVSPNGSPTQSWFEWGVASVSENRTAIQSLGNTGSGLAVSQTISGLLPSTTYRFRMVAENGIGVKAGAEQSFTTPAPPAAPLICTSGSLEFSLGQQDVPASQSISVRNCGTGTLAYSVSTDSPWLSLSVGSGTSTGEVDAVSVSVDPAGLRPGFYASTVKILDFVTGNSPQYVAVYVRVSAPEPARVRRPFAFPYHAGSIGAAGWKIRRDAAGNVFVGGVGGAGNPVQGVFKYDSEGNPLGEIPAGGYQFAIAPSSSVGVLSVPDGTYQVQVKQYSVNGSLQWSQTYSPGEATPQVIEGDSIGNFYVGGREVKRVVKNGADPFLEHGLLVKFTSAGAVAWARNIPFLFDFQNARVTDLVVTPGGSVYAAGTIRRMNVVVASNGSYSVNTTNDFRPFIAKYDSSGNNIWMTALAEGSAYEDLSTRLAADDSAEFLIFPSVNPADGRTGYFTAKLNPSGQVLWSQWSSDPESQLLARSATVDEVGSLYVAGVAVASVYNRSGTFVEKFDTSGQKKWGQRFAPGPVELGEYIAGELLSVTNDGNRGVLASGGLFGKFPGEGRPWAWRYTKDGVMESMHPPAGVAGISSIPLGVSSLTWTWSDGPDELAYRAVSFKSGISSGKLPQDTTTWVMTALSTNTWYEAQVFALNDDGVAASTAVRGCTLAATPATPIVLAQAPFRATLSWSPNSNPAGTDYEVFASSYSTPSDLPGVRVSGSTGAVVAGLLPSTTYYFFVRAVNRAGVPSSFSSAVSSFTLSAPQGVASKDLSVFGGSVVASDSKTAVNFTAGIPPEARGFLSKDPLVTPIIASTADIVTANLSVPSTQRLLAGSIREIVIMAGDAPYESGLSGVLTLPYDDSDDDGFVDNLSPPVRPDQLAIYTVSNARWEQVAGSLTVDKASRTISVPISHLSVFAVLATIAAADCEGARAYPVPWKPGSGDRFDSASVAGCGRGIVIDKLTNEASIRIYNVLGDLVRELSVLAADAGCKAWDGKNEAGNDVASGIYFARLSCSSGPRTLKLAVER